MLVIESTNSRIFICMDKNNIYIGEIIKEIMQSREVSKAELARRLHVKPQSVDYLLTRKSVDTDTLYNISLALDYDFALLYSTKKEQINFDNKKSDIKIGGAKVIIEVELKSEDLSKLNLKKKILDIIENESKNNV